MAQTAKEKLAEIQTWQVPLAHDTERRALPRTPEEARAWQPKNRTRGQ